MNMVSFPGYVIAPRAAGQPHFAVPPNRPSSRIYFRHHHSGMIPNTPKEQSISRQPNGMPRIPPAHNANGTTSAHAIIPNSTTQIFLTGFLNGPTNATAITKCANASQSVPYAMNGYFA